MRCDEEGTHVIIHHMTVRNDCVIVTQDMDTDVHTRAGMSHGSSQQGKSLVARSASAPRLEARSASAPPVGGAKRPCAPGRRREAPRSGATARSARAPPCCAAAPLMRCLCF